MTESQRSFLTGYLGEQWKGNITDAICERCGTVFSVNRTFTEPQDKQDLLEAIDKKGEWGDFINIAYVGYSKEFPLLSGDKINMTVYRLHHNYQWLILLSPEATAELICRWKGIS